MKTLAIRLEEDLHAQLSVLAKLRESTITDEIRQAIEGHIAASRHDAQLKHRGQAVLDDFERAAKVRRLPSPHCSATPNHQRRQLTQHRQTTASPTSSASDGQSGKAGRRASARQSE